MKSAENVIMKLFPLGPKTQSARIPFAPNVECNGPDSIAQIPLIIVVTILVQKMKNDSM